MNAIGSKDSLGIADAIALPESEHHSDSQYRELVHVMPIDIIEQAFYELFDCR